MTTLKFNNVYSTLSFLYTCTFVVAYKNSNVSEEIICEYISTKNPFLSV